MPPSSSKIPARARAWLQAGLISQAQAESIAAYEASRAPRFNPLAWLAVAGGSCVALGMVLLVSHNWESIPAWLKQGAFIACLALAAFGAGWSEDKPGLGPGLALIWMGLPLAGIGLWAQVYHLSGEPLRPLFAWLLLTLPLAWMARHPAPARLHAFGLLATAFYAAFSSGGTLSLVNNQAAHAAPWPGLGRWCLNLAGLAFLWALAGLVTQRRLGLPAKTAFLAAACLFIGGLGFAGTPLEIESRGVGMLLACGLGVCFWFGCRAWGLAGPRLRELGFIIVAGLVYCLSFTREDHGADRLGEAGGLHAAFWGLAALLLALFGPWKKMQLSKPWIGRVSALMPLLLVGLALSPAPGWSVGLAANLGLAALCVIWMFESAAQGHGALLDLSTLLLGLLLFTRFIDYFGSLLKSGLGFIATGLVFLGLAFILRRSRDSLRRGEAAP
jgi:uncharacterized membrane protein